MRGLALSTCQAYRHRISIVAVTASPPCGRRIPRGSRRHVEPTGASAAAARESRHPHVVDDRREAPHREYGPHLAHVTRCALLTSAGSCSLRSDTRGASAFLMPPFLHAYRKALYGLITAHAHGASAHGPGVFGSAANIRIRDEDRRVTADHKMKTHDQDKPRCVRERGG
jgi:hypothetical protein